ncbi:MAG: fructosamine kinase family protein [Leptospirales bacterium]|nr:fructosamine kinase family protein [Leptospirales bacterium]
MPGAEETIRAGLESLRLLDAGSASRASISRYASGLFQIYLIRSRPAQSREDTRFIAKPLPADVAEAEWDGLQSLHRGGAKTPELFGIYHCAPTGMNSHTGEAVLFMEFCSGQPVRASSLKQLYARKHEYWGYHRHNFIGRLNQTNSRHESFDEFWWQDRIEPQLRLARDSGLLDQQDSTAAEHIVSSLSHKWRLSEIGPRLVHGDLWNGNVIANETGEAVFIDPSVAYSHPEQDFAMLELFGSPVSQSEIDNISRTVGLPPGRNERIPFFQLYPLLVHVNLFGHSYVGGVRRILRQYA